MKKQCDKELKAAQKKCNENIRDIVLKESQDGFIVVACVDGLQKIKLSEFIKQPIEGILYDLNRDEITVLTFIDDTKWINDYACAKTIEALKNKIEELEQKIK